MSATFVFELPAALRAQGFGVRPERDDDTPFLLALYGSTREAELALLPLDAEQKQAFVAAQFQAQRRHYRSYFPDCAFDVLDRHGEPGGRLYLDATPSRLRIVDIALVPQWRGAGLGTALLRVVQACARDGGRGVGLFVDKSNPALRLYRRLGFGEIADRGPYLEMEWLPDGAQLNVA